MEGQVALHAFLYAQTHSSGSAIYLGLCFLHGAFFNRSKIPDILESVIDGWNKGHEYRSLWGIALENLFKEDLATIRNNYRIQQVDEKRKNTQVAAEQKFEKTG
jgi:ubiquinone biosynthesis protein Coq4